MSWTRFTLQLLGSLLFLGALVAVPLGLLLLALGGPGIDGSTAPKVAGPVVLALAAALAVTGVALVLLSDRLARPGRDKR